MDLMATTASSHRIPVGVVGAGDRLPFHSRYNTDECSGVDVFGQHVSVMPDTSRQYFGFGFPIPTTVGVVLQHMEERQAHAVVEVPDQKLQRFTKLAGAMVPSRLVSEPGDDRQFFQLQH